MGADFHIYVFFTSDTEDAMQNNITMTTTNTEGRNYNFTTAQKIKMLINNLTRDPVKGNSLCVAYLPK